MLIYSIIFARTKLRKESSSHVKRSISLSIPAWQHLLTNFQNCKIINLNIYYPGKVPIFPGGIFFGCKCFTEEKQYYEKNTTLVEEVKFIPCQKIIIQPIQYLPASTYQLPIFSYVSCGIIKLSIYYPANIFRLIANVSLDKKYYGKNLQDHTC